MERGYISITPLSVDLTDVGELERLSDRLPLDEPPRADEAAEAVDLVGLLTKAAELAALVSCAVLWFRAGQARRREVGADEPVVVKGDRA